jgi:hypothetical protein
MCDAAASHFNGLQFFVILSEAKNLLRVIVGFKILRFAQNDKACYTLECDARRHHTLLFLFSFFSFLFAVFH